MQWITSSPVASNTPSPPWDHFFSISLALNPSFTKPMSESSSANCLFRLAISYKQTEGCDGCHAQWEQSVPVAYFCHWDCQTLCQDTNADLPGELFLTESSPCSSCSLLESPLWYLNAIPDWEDGRKPLIKHFHLNFKHITKPWERLLSFNSPYRPGEEPGSHCFLRQTPASFCLLLPFYPMVTPRQAVTG